MTLDELYKKYGSYLQISKRLGFANATPFYWRKIGYIPIETQLQIEKITRGEFMASLNDIGKIND